MLTIYTDGACEPNPGSAGCGFAVYRNGILADLLYGLYHQGTSNTAELNALYHALQLAAQEQGNVRIFSDSKYSIDCITNWAFKWKLKDWKKKGGPIKNLDTIWDAHELFLQIDHRVEIAHVRGHMGVQGNELADRMAVQAIDQQCTDMRVYEAVDVDCVLALRAG
jgi:ribonuclease HI